MTSVSHPSTADVAVTDPGAPHAPIPLGGVAAVAGAVLLAATNALVALTPDYVGAMTGEEVLGAVADNPGLLEATGAVGLASAALLVPGIWAVSAGLRRSRVLAGLGGWVMGTAYVFGTALHVELFVMLALVSGDVDLARAGAALEATPVTGVVMYSVFGIGAFLGSILLGAAMLREPGVPRWAGWALVLSVPVRIAGLVFSVAAGPPLASLLVAAAFAGAVFLRRR